MTTPKAMSDETMAASTTSTGFALLHVGFCVERERELPHDGRNAAIPDDGSRGVLHRANEDVAAPL